MLARIPMRSGDAAVSQRLTVAQRFFERLGAGAGIKSATAERARHAVDAEGGASRRMLTTR